MQQEVDQDCKILAEVVRQERLGAMGVVILMCLHQFNFALLRPWTFIDLPEAMVSEILAMSLPTLKVTVFLLHKEMKGSMGITQAHFSPPQMQRLTAGHHHRRPRLQSSLILIRKVDTMDQLAHIADTNQFQ